MVFFVIYAVLVWWLATRWRRQWKGLAAAFGGVLGIALIAFVHWRLSEWTNRQIYLEVLQVLLYPYGVTVGAVALFLTALPRARPIRRCANCGYDLRGLPASTALGLICPECGRRMLGSSRPEDSPARQTPDHSGQQDAKR